MATTIGLPSLTISFQKAAQAAACLIAEGPDKAMNKFNG